MKRIVSVVFLLLFLILLSSCSTETMVVLKDSGTETVIQTKTETSIKDLLKQNGIVLAEKDEVEPSLDSKITEDTAEIIVKRYAKVVVVKKGEEKEIELVGATVADAIEKSGFEIEEDEEVDKDYNTYLTDGMVIRIQKEISVSLSVDGTSKDIKTKAATINELLEEQNITLGNDDEISEKTDALLEEGMKITIKRIEYKEETRKETIEYDTEERTSDSMYKGESEITQEGLNGEKEVVYRVKYVDGVEDSKEKLSETITKEPVTKIITNGTKSKMLTAEDAQKIAIKHWNLDNSSGVEFGVFVDESPTTKGGTLYYQCYLKYRHDGIYSTWDYLYVNAKTGEAKTIDEVN